MDILCRFRNYGQVFISWVNETSAFVTLHNRDHAAAVLKTIDKSNVAFTICTLNQFKAKQQVLSTPPTLQISFYSFRIRPSHSVLELSGDTIVVVPIEEGLNVRRTKR